MRSNSTEECVMVAQAIFNQISGDFTPEILKFWGDSIAYIANTRSSYNKNEKWQADVYGNRYGVKASIPGLLGEMIVIAALLRDESSADIEIATSKSDQVIHQLDLVDTATDTSYQVKTIRTLCGMVPEIPWKVTSPDCLVLVDIDDNAVYVIPTSGYDAVIDAHPDTRSYGRDGVRLGWSVSVEMLQEINILPTSSTSSLYTKPTFSPAEISAFKWESVAS